MLMSEISPIYYEPVLIRDENTIEVLVTSNLHIDLTDIFVGLTPYPLTFYVRI